MQVSLNNNNGTLCLLQRQEAKGNQTGRAGSWFATRKVDDWRKGVSSGTVRTKGPICASEAQEQRILTRVIPTLSARVKHQG